MLRKRSKDYGISITDENLINTPSATGTKKILYEIRGIYITFISRLIPVAYILI